MALIEEAELEFGRGLHILSGETGAGKSLLLGSVSMALGQKAGTDLIRQGADSALAELIFTIDRDDLAERIREMDIPLEEDGTLILQRSIRGGRSVCRINGETFPASRVKEVAALLIDVHGQHEHQSLLHTKNHRLILDSYAGGELAGILQKVSVSYKAYQEVLAELNASSIDEREKERQIDLLTHEISEIEEANLTEGEDEDLENKFHRLSNGRKILEAVGAAHEMTGNAGVNAADLIGSAVRELHSVESYDEPLLGMSALLSDIDNLLNDFNREISAYLQSADFSEEEYEKVARRLDLLNRMKSRYGNSIGEIEKYREEKQKELSKLLDFDLYRQKLEKCLKEREEELEGFCEEASRIRKTAARNLEEKLQEALLELNFAQADFRIRFQRSEHYTKDGYDEIEFLISTNPGESVKPLSQVASGGELSRIMLAIRTVSAVKDGIDTLIFDEIDTGISGKTAAGVAKQLSLLAKQCQVICITHLPQIASYADHHYCIEKNTEGGMTRTLIRELGEDESIEEITRLLGGSDAARENARQMRMDAKKV